MARPLKLVPPLAPAFTGTDADLVGGIRRGEPDARAALYDWHADALRARFPGSPEAAFATFMLGRIAQDQSKDYAAAAVWFTRYLSEQPGGAFAAEALGRLVEVDDEQGDPAGARLAAARYLAAYPDGAHAGYARRVLAQAGAPSP